jgi:hypothetical protein
MTLSREGELGFLRNCGAARGALQFARPAGAACQGTRLPSNLAALRATLVGVR